MGYSQVLQTGDSAPSKFSRGNGALPITDPLPFSQGVTDQLSFNGTYNNGSNQGFRVTVQTGTQIFDPSKQYRVTIEEVTA